VINLTKNMEQPSQNDLIQNEPAQIKSPKTVWVIVITAILVAVLVGVGVYMLQLQRVRNFEKQLSQVNQTLSALDQKNVITDKKINNNQVDNANKTSTTTISNLTNTTTVTGQYDNLPLVKKLFTMPSSSDILSSYGTAKVKGYLSIETRVCQPGYPCSKTVESASLIITEEPSNSDFAKFIDLGNGDGGNNTVVGDKISLGCYEKDKNRIYSVNFGGLENDMTSIDSFENIITGDDLKKLLNSTKNNPVTIRATKSYPAFGRGAPDCYSFLRYFEVYQE